MRLTVGPLPPAVYWRRRAVVLGAALLFLTVLFYSCANSGKSATSDSDNSPTSPSGSPVLTPETGTSPTDEVTDEPTADPQVTTSASAPAVVDVPATGECTDDEISVIPASSQSSARRGATIELRLKIKNISDRTCDRDVGAGPQEIYIMIGGQRIWSSDTCGDLAQGADVRSFTPGFEREYRVIWNGKEVRDSSECANGAANGETPQPGEYQILGRLGTKISEPVKLTITG